MNKQIDIFADKGLTTIFDGALLSQTEKASNELNQLRVIGYRLESIHKESVKVIARMPEDENGVYTATVFYEGVRRRGKSKSSSFFPKHWTKDETINAIFEAYQNKTVRDISNKKYIGKTQKGMDVILWLDANEKVIDAMPFRDVIKQLKNREKAKSLCKVCGKPKERICLPHHTFKKKGIEKVLAIIKRYSRKFYFSAARKLKLVE